ncbi:hypothetical protein G6M50_07760 [Agrobacterium rhizogenes]|nr:hypothetical protein [Rhizobium rhizogenes]NTJ77694.1 hypothetical protein [Rhizobium rhizogenes]
MERLDARIDGSIRLDRDVRFYGLITGSLTVPKGRICELHGTISHDLIVEPGATAVVYGTVAGLLRNQGGDVRVFGSVGSVVDSDATKPTDLSSPAAARAGS